MDSRAAQTTDDPTPFVVLLGTDYAGKSSALAELARSPVQVDIVSTDDAFVSAEHALISQLRRDVLREVLPALNRDYSADFLVGLLQTAVIYLRDRIGRGRSHPVLVDSYYYKVLAKCRLAGVPDNPMFDWWRSFPKPRRVVFLEVDPATAWRRSRHGEAANPLEHYGRYPDRSSFERFQADLRAVMLQEISNLPISVIGEQDSPVLTAAAIQEVLSDERQH